MYKLSIFCLLFIITFRECVILFDSASLIGIIFMLGKFPGNEYFRIEIASPSSMCWMLNFSVIVMKRLLKALATFLGSFKFSSFTGKVVPCSHECTCSCLFLQYIPRCCYFVIRFCYKSTAVLLLRFFYNFSWVLQYLI